MQAVKIDPKHNQDVDNYNRDGKQRTSEVVARVKRLIKPSLKPDDWSKYKLCTFSFNEEDYVSNIDVIHHPAAGLVEFFKAKGTPILIKNVVTNWPAFHEWTLEKLYEKYSNEQFKVGEDDDGRSVKMRLKHYIRYMQETVDDSPFTLFDSSFGERTGTRKLLADYTVPEFFSMNWYKYSDRDRMPPHCWFVMGPARSGTGIHIDPMGTSAWNALVQGTKLWAMFPPNTPKEMIKIPKDALEGKLRHESVRWFRTVYYKSVSSSWPEQYKPVICIQRSGDLIYVPSGWWHVVMNLDNTVAVTENFCDKSNFLTCMKVCRRSRHGYSVHWLKTLKRCSREAVKAFPEIFATIDGYDEANSNSSSSGSSSSDYVTDSENSYASDVDDEVENKTRRDNTCLASSRGIMDENSVCYSVSNCSVEARTSGNKRTSSNSSGPQARRPRCTT
ncbi:hypothetical protein FO519_003014 [Halicephalobus sp. NKZ332]|nr:hypothetical protein FO519_003014 [Halicephalobus sp. NKZ332]